MNAQQRGRARRLRSVAALPVPATRESAETILPGTPRVGELDALLRDVDSLRLTLETDLSLVAAAVAAGRTDTANEILDGDRDSLAAFETSALGHLSELARVPGTRRARWARLPAAPFVAAAAIIGFLVGVVPQGVGTARAPIAVSAQSSLARLTTFAAQGQTGQVRVTSATLHQQISALVSQASTNPEAASQALLLLSYERAAIVQSGDSVALRDVLVASAALTTRIQNALPRGLRSGIPVAPAFAVPEVTPSSKPSSSPSPKPSASASPKPSPSESSAKPSGSPKPSPSQSSPGLVPPTPATNP